MRKETPEEKRRRIMNAAREALSGSYAGEEHAIIQASNTYNAVDKIRNLLYERLDEWYGIYFPELRLTNQVAYAKFVLGMGGNKREASKEAISDIVGDEKANEVYESIQKSIGREPGKEEYNAIRLIAENEIALARLQDNLDEYLKESTKRVMPNISYLIDYKIGAELLAKAGSLKRLAMLPASTIQLLGAEKALFKHIKFKSRPPKYGVIFKLPQISAANRSARGRLARAYAAKICIAAKADAFSKNFIAERLKKDMEERERRVAQQAKEDLEKGKPFNRMHNNRPRPNVSFNDRGERRHGRNNWR